MSEERMTNADKIRNMSDDELKELLVWGSCFSCGIEVPDCDDGCEYETGGCALNCPHDRRERAVREWLQYEQY